MRLPEEVVSFFRKQSYVIFSTVDGNGRPHSVAKGVVDIEEKGAVILLDLYRGLTRANLIENANASITAIDEREFAGYTLKGRAVIIELDGLTDAVREKWRMLLKTRISRRIIRNVRSEIAGTTHHEAHLPEPEYVIAFKCSEVVDLSHRAGDV